MPTKKRKAVTFDLIRDLAFKHPGVEDGTSYGTRALRVKGKFLARLKEDGESVVFRVGFDDRDLLLQTRPEVFYITDHYLGYPAVLMRLSAATAEEAADIVALAWGMVAPKRLQKEK
ncbi:MAG: hypothetical protein QOC81_389 [Thermoanaerobaculia bacterium]|jgi:hypothetical protein|nr:hypothetical protein [Thermoanaerobaculia bacterium]